MDAARFDRISEVFDAVRSLPPSERAEQLLALCGDDAALADEVRALLTHHDAEDHGLDVPVWNRTDDSADTPPLPDIEGYELHRTLGEGGMGVVYLATQLRPHRTVAIKMLRSVLASPDVRRRFEREMEILGRLAHPGIVPIYSVGASGSQPYFTMEYVEGQSLLSYCRDRALDRRERLALFVSVCDAVQYAHDAGVIHRDLKPANVIVDAGGRPRVLDFGIAKSTDLDVCSSTMQTDVGLLLGTLPYMSPEQVRGTSSAIDGRSDVYALGVLAFELLSGQLPYDLEGKPMPEAMRLITDTDVTSLSSIDQDIRGDIETILTKALEKDPDRRYERPADFANDVRRYLNDQPIEARPVSLMYQIQKFTRRNRAFVSALVAVFVVLVAGTSVSLWFGIGANNARRHAVESEAVTAERAYQANLAAGDAAIRASDGVSARQRLSRIDPEQRDTWEYRYLWNRIDQSTDALVFQDVAAHTVAWSADGALLALGLPQPRVQRMEDGTFIDLAQDSASEASHFLTRPRVMRFSADGRLVAAGCVDKFVRVWDATTGALIARLDGHDGQVSGVWFSPDGKFLWSVGFDRRVMRSRLDGTNVHELQYSVGGTVVAMDVSSDQALMALAYHEGWGSIVSLETGVVLAALRGHTGSLTGIAFGPGDAEVATSSVDGTVRLWEVVTGAQREVFDDESTAVLSLAFTADGSQIISGSQNGGLHVWDVASRRRSRVLLGHTDRVLSLSCRSQDGMIASASRDYTVRFWSPPGQGVPDVLVGHAGAVHQVAMNGDGSTVVSAGVNRALRSWSTDTGTGLAHGMSSTIATQLAWDASSDGWHLARAGGVALHDGERLQQIEAQDFDASTGNVSFDSSGSVYVALGATSADVGTVGRLGRDDSAWTFAMPEERVHAAGVARDGAWVALGSVNGTVRVVRRGETDESGDVTMLPDGFDTSVISMAVHSSAELCAAGSVGGAIRLWRLVNGVVAGDSLELMGHSSTVTSLVFHPTQPRLISGASDGSIRVWDTDTGAELLLLHGHTNAVNALCFDALGETLVSGSSDRTVRLWRGPDPGSFDE